MPRPKNSNRESIRSERVPLAMTPAGYDKLATLAVIRGVSINELVNAILEPVLERNSATIDSFNAARQKAADEIDLAADIPPAE